MKDKIIKKSIAILLSLCMCIGMFPMSALAENGIAAQSASKSVTLSAGKSAALSASESVAMTVGESVTQSTAESTPFTSFKVYQNADVNPSGDEITDSIDLSQELYIETSKEDDVGYRLWRCDNGEVPPADLSREMTTADGLYPLHGSFQYSEDYTKKVATGLKLEYLNGQDYSPIPAGTYRFVAFLFFDAGIKYSPEFTVTDKNGLSSTFEATFYSGVDEHGGYTPYEGTTTLINGETASLFMSDFAPALTDTPVSRVILKRQDALQEQVIWDGGSSNGTLIDKRTEGPNVQILHEFTVEGSDIQSPIFFPSMMIEGLYSVAVEVGDKTYISSNVITVKDKTAAPTIDTDSLPNVITGTEYSQTLSATPANGGDITWSITEGSLPDGLSLSGDTITGTPTAAGSFTFTVQVTETVDDETITATREFTIKVTDKLEITNETTSFDLNRGLFIKETLTSNLEDVTWKITSGSLPDGLYLVDNAITGAVTGLAESGSYQVTVQASADDQTATKVFTFQIGDLFRFNLTGIIDSDAMVRHVYLRAKSDQSEEDITLWQGTLTADTESLMLDVGFAGTKVSDVRLITYVSTSGSDGTVLAEHSGSLTLADGESADLTGKGDMLVKLPEISHEYGENAQIHTYFKSGIYTYYPGTIVAADSEFTLYASAYGKGEDDPLAEYDLTTATFSGAGVSGTTYKPEENTNGEDITVSYPRYELTTVTVKLEPEIHEDTVPDLSYAELHFNQRINDWTYSYNAVVGADNTCTVKLYSGVAGTVTMINAGDYVLSVYDIAADSIRDNTMVLNFNGAEERRMAVMITGKLANDDADFAAYAEALDANAQPQAESGGKSWSIRSEKLSALLKGSVQFKLWDYSSSNELKALAKNGGTLKLSYEDSGALLDSSTEIEWKQNSLTGTVEQTIDLRGGVLFDLNYESSSRVHMNGWWHQKNGDTDTWVEGQSKTLYGGDNTIAQYCPGGKGDWDFILLPDIANPNSMTWDEVLKANPDMPNETNITIADNTVVKLSKQTMNVLAANSALYLTLPGSTLTGPSQFDTINDTLVFNGHIELDKGADNKMQALRLDVTGIGSNSVSTQISSVVINGKTYPYTGNKTYSDYAKDKLVYNLHSSYYELIFDEPIELPCDITVYGKPATANSDAVLDMSVLLTDKVIYQPVSRVEVSAPGVSVNMPNTVGGKTFNAYVTIPAGGSVDIYDGVDLVSHADQTGYIKITLSGACDSVITSHDLRFVLHDKDGNEVDTYTQTVLHANGTPTLYSQNMQTQQKNFSYWKTIQQNQKYTWSEDWNQFRMTAILDNPENLKEDSVVFAVRLLDGTIHYLEGKADATKDGAFISETLTTSSPVIGGTVLYEIDWDKVDETISNALAVPGDSPTATGYNFDQTIVLDYADVKNELPTTVPGSDDEWTEEEKAEIEEIKKKIEDIYNRNRGDVGYYTIIGDGSEFFSGQEMFEELDSSVLPEGYIGGSTFTRPLNEEQFGVEIGSGEGWNCLTFTEPGGNNWGGLDAGGETGMEIYTSEITTGDGGVNGTLTITRIGEDIYETGIATVQGTGSEGITPPELPESGSISPGGVDFGFSGDGNPDGVDVFSDYCEDVNARASILKDLLEFLGEEGTKNPYWKFGGEAANGLGALKSALDGLSNDEDLQGIFKSVNSLLDSRCAQKLSPIIRDNLQSQINNFNKMAVEAMQWNTVNTLGGTTTGLLGMVVSINPATGLFTGIALYGVEKINRQQIDNVKQEAQLIRDLVRMQINKYARANNDPDCAEAAKSTYQVIMDPSGIVYEAVLSNPVEGATVTLYTADGDYVPQYTKDANGAEVYVDENGNPVAPDNAYTGNGNLTTPDVNNLEPGVLTMITDADGRYQWMVPAGLWYVTAEKGEDGYVPGSSNNDIAAVVSENGTNWLPVLPAQLNVNIPLVSYDIPTVTAEYDTDGVYLTFSKYMDETTLKAEGAFKIDGKAVDPDNVVLLNSEQAPSNINYGTESAPSYTSMVKLAATNLTGEVTVTIGSGVKSYAGVPCTTNTSGITVAHIVFSHDYSTEWSSDADGHWHECYHCHDKADEAAHTPDREEATETDPIKCVECGYIITPALGHTHNLTKIEAKPATRTEDGNIEYYICEGCDLLFADAAGSVEITEAQTVVAATGNVSNYEQGDLTRDGKVNLYDAVEIAKYMMNMIKLDEEQLSLGDMNGDGKVNLYDAIAVCNIIMG